MFILTFITKKRTIEYYYFTLTGMLAKNSCFQTIYWFDFYSTTLNNMDFQDEALNCLAAAIRFQANVYNKLISVDNLKNLPYKQLFSDDTYWIRPYTLFVSGVNNDLWGLTATDYSIYNENINGQGHSEFTTNFKKSSWYKIGEQHNDTVHLFIRCEWAKSGLCIYLNWENFDSEAQINEEGIVNNYIATKCLSETVKKQTIKNKHTYMRYWQKPEHLKTVTVTDKKDAVLRILKCCIDCKDKSVGEVLKEAIQVIEYYENEIQRILNGLSLEKGLLIYSSDLPNK